MPPPDGFSLHLSQAAVPATAPENQRVSVLLKHGEDDAAGVVICTLAAGAPLADTATAARS